MPTPGRKGPRRGKRTRRVIDIHHGDNLEVLRTLPRECFDLVYIDPPFNSGRAQTRTKLKTVRDEDGDRTGFKGQRYRTVRLGSQSFGDRFDAFLAFLEPRLEEIVRTMRPAASLFVHLDAREVHYVKVLLDGMLGRDRFMNEIIWAYDYGARSKRRWPAKHDTILWYAKDPENYTFHFDEIDRVPYLAPALVGDEKAERGKTPTDVWWHTIVSPTGKERTGYPTQKPRGVIDRILRVHSNPGDAVLDAFAGSGTVGESAWALGRDAVLIDENPEAIEVMRTRLASAKPRIHGAAAATGAEPIP